MMKAYLIVSLVFVCITMSACNKKACERYCNACAGEDIDLFGDYVWDDLFGDSGNDSRSVVPGASGCEEACQDELDGEDLDCRAAIRRAARCLDQLSCDPGECTSPLSDVEFSCSF